MCMSLSPEIEGMPAWSARLSSNVLPQYAVAIASSNLWPGAHAYAAGRYVHHNPQSHVIPLISLYILPSSLE